MCVCVHGLCVCVYMCVHVCRVCRNGKGYVCVGVGGQSLKLSEMEQLSTDIVVASLAVFDVELFCSTSY